METLEKFRSFLSDNDYCVKASLARNGCNVQFPSRLVTPSGEAIRCSYRINRAGVKQRGFYATENGEKIKDVDYHMPAYAVPAFIYCDIIRVCININYSHDLICFFQPDGKEVTALDFFHSFQPSVKEELKEEYKEKSEVLGTLFLDAYRDSFQSDYEATAKELDISEGFYMLKGIFWEILGQ